MQTPCLHPLEVQVVARSLCGAPFLQKVFPSYEGQGFFTGRTGRMLGTHLLSLHPSTCGMWVCCGFILNCGCRKPWEADNAEGPKCNVYLGGGMGEAAQSCSSVILPQGAHLPAVTGDVIQWEGGVGLHLHGTVLLGDVVTQGRVMSSGTDRGSTCGGRARAGLAPGVFSSSQQRLSPQLALLNHTISPASDEGFCFVFFPLCFSLGNGQRSERSVAVLKQNQGYW